MVFILGTPYLYLRVLRLHRGEVGGKRTRHSVTMVHMQDANLNGNWFWTLAQSEQICRSCSLLSTNIVSCLCLQFQQQSRLAWQVGLLSSQFQIVLFQQVTGLHPEELLLWFWTGLSGRIWTTWASPSPNYNCLISLGMGHAEFCKTLSVVFDQRWKHRDLGKIVGATASNSPIRFVQEHA